MKHESCQRRLDYFTDDDPTGGTVKYIFSLTFITTRNLTMRFA